MVELAGTSLITKHVSMQNDGCRDFSVRDICDGKEIVDLMMQEAASSISNVRTFP